MKQSLLQAGKPSHLRHQAKMGADSFSSATGKSVSRETLDLKNTKFMLYYSIKETRGRSPAKKEAEKGLSVLKTRLALPPTLLLEEEMGKIIAVANQKGGVGKTTSAVNIAAALGAAGKKTLLLDADPQGNATSGFGVNKREIRGSVYDMLITGARAEDILIRTPFQNVDLLASNIALAGAELELVEITDRTERLKIGLATLKAQYDYILIDCPPSLGLITINALTAADSVLVPIQCEFYALEGLSQLIATIRKVKRMYNPHIDIEGVLLTMYDGRLNLTVQVVQEVKRHFPQKVYKTVIPRNIRLSEAPSFGQPVMYFDRASKGAQAYGELAEEIIQMNEKRGG